ncbi:endonuclease domain-containing protein [Sporocytophaga myxococcoides]|uniref:endonuclease domain-containing protein n=1 Tax=Sporocytophaga myxococcoides TaxID=153721 RepID=UPI000688162A|nr:endonuclease domain-containing protein [Sporocytophaga myxococcoides]
MDKNLHKGASSKLFEYAKQNRLKQTPTEEMLWQKLRNNQLGFKFRRQHPLKNYIADFYCHECSLIIEIDGEYHAELEQMDYDSGRTFEIEEHNLTVLRFSNDDVKLQIDKVLESIKKYLIPSPSPEGEGNSLQQ